jgi:hypothetical protein
MCVCVCVDVDVRVSVSVYAYGCVCGGTYIPILHTTIHVQTHLYVCVCSCVRVSVRVYVCVCVLSDILLKTNLSIILMMASSRHPALENPVTFVQTTFHQLTFSPNANLT